MLTNTDLMPQLEEELERAIAQPQSADFDRLWNLMLAVLEPLPRLRQFEVAGDVILQLADLLLVRADQLLSPKSVEDDSAGISPTRELLDQFTRSLTFNLAAVTKPPITRRRSQPSPEGSIVAEVDKTALLAVLDAESTKQAALDLAHEERIEDWAVQLHQVFSESSSVALVDLVQQSQMPLVQVWQTVLLGQGFELEQQGEFYQVETVQVRGTHGLQ
jgi:hypothetical protein